MRMILLRTALALTLIGCFPTAMSDTNNFITETLNNSIETKNEVTLSFNGNTISMVAVEIADGYVLGRTYELHRIVVRLDAIDAAWMKIYSEDG